MSGRFVYIAFITLLNFSIAYGQETMVDTSQLPKYSYLIYGYAQSGNSVQATGFFVKKKGHTYLVTASHVVNGWFFASFDKKGSYPDILFVIVGLKNTRRDTSLAIDISSLKYTKADPYSHDIYFIPIDVPSNCVTNSLESLILSFTPISKTPETILVYGFVADDQTISLQQFKGLKPTKAIARLPDWNDYSCSPLVYEISYTSDDLGPGDSGAPIYFITQNNFGNKPNSDKLQFGGLLFGGDSKRHRAGVIRAELVKVLYNEL
ncbi:MAG TPA: hypothetical protein VIM89_05205 [Mucilaginibacter sp.]